MSCYDTEYVIWHVASTSCYDVYCRVLLVPVLLEPHTSAGWYDMDGKSWRNINQCLFVGGNWTMTEPLSVDATSTNA